MNAPLRQGATVVVLPRFELETVPRGDRGAPLNVLYVAPPIVLALAKHPAVDKYDLSSLQYVLSARPRPWTPSSPRACRARLGCRRSGRPTA